MSCTKFKLTTVAALVLAATQANAALYTVVEVESPVDANETYGVAIQPSTGSALGNLGCFDENATSAECEGYKLAGETRNSVEAVSYREEVPFAMDTAFQYIQDRDDFEYYCDRELKYSTCESWANKRWSTWSREKNNLASVNSQAFVEGDSNPISPYNSVINALDFTGAPIGIESDGTSIRNNAVTTVNLNSTTSETRAWKALTVGSTTYNVGSISTANSNDNGNYFNSRAAIWDGTNQVSISWVSGSSQTGDFLAQGSMRGLAEKDGLLYGIGYNNEDGSGDLQDLNASIFVSTGLDLANDTWATRVVSGTRVESSDDYLYSNSVATDINDNLLVIGHAKRRGEVPENGSASTKMFVVADAAVSNPSASFFSGGIFFTGAGGEAKAVNNFNEIVGQVDAESNREIDGKERRHRGFIYPYNDSIDATRSAIFNNKAWWLDDLTNDGNPTGSNNHFRILDATDINDAGVISATAVKCTVNGSEQAYDTTSHNSYCGGAGSGAVEEVVAVKLVPIAGATASDIQTRGTETPTVERQGAGLGIFVLTVLGFLGFRRK